MRFMALIKATPETEAGVLPSEQLLAEMGAFNAKLVDAGVLVAGEGLRDSSKGAKVRFSASGTTVVDGPFTETKELIAGFWILEVGSREEAVEWIRQVPNPDGAESEIEIRQVFEADDFGDNLTPELKAAEGDLRKRAAEQRK